LNVHQEALIHFPDTVDFDTISSSFVNPVTACGFVDTCHKKGVKAVIQDAAASALGRMFIKLC